MPLDHVQADAQLLRDLTLPVTLDAEQPEHFTRPRRQPSDLMVELWLAPTLGYLPVRLRITPSSRP